MYYLNLNENPIGPMTVSQLMAYNVDENSMVSTDGTNFKPLYTYPELMEALSYNRKSESKRILCGVLALLLGGFGIHYFVINKGIAGIITIVLTLITCGIWSLVTFVQGIMILCMSDRKFEEKYVNNIDTFPIF